MPVFSFVFFEPISTSARNPNFRPKIRLKVSTRAHFDPGRNVLKSRIRLKVWVGPNVRPAHLGLLSTFGGAKLSAAHFAPRPHISAGRWRSLASETGWLFCSNSLATRSPSEALRPAVERSCDDAALASKTTGGRRAGGRRRHTKRSVHLWQGLSTDDR